MWGIRGSNAKSILDAVSNSQAIIEFDAEGKILSANENFLKTLGYSLNEIVGKHHSIFVDASEVKSAPYQKFWADLRQGQFQQAEFRRIGKGGKIVWIQATYNPIMGRNGQLQRVVKIATDITEQKLHNADLQGQIQAIGKSQAVIEFDLDGKILTANANFLQALGYTLNEIVGQHHSMFVEPKYRSSPEYRAFWDDLRAGKFQQAEYLRLGKGGREVWIQATYNPIFDMNGKPFKVVKYATDITAAMAERLRRQDAQKQINSNLTDIMGLVENTAKQSTSGASTATQTSGNVQAVASGAEELATSVAEISRQVSTALSITEDAVTQAEHTNNVISGLAGAAQRIGQVVELISNIAAQTNLLALNATIEAARAGDAGRGFAVVASEVKQLAAQTGKATDDISSQINEIQMTTSNAVQAISDISGTISRINDISASIASAVEEQSAVTKDMSSNMHVAAFGVETITNNMSEIARSAEQVNVATRNVKELSMSLN